MNESKETALQTQQEVSVFKEKAKEKKAISRLRGGISSAVVSLLKLSRHRDPWVRLRACEDILNHYWKIQEWQEFEGRLKTIERIIFERKTFK